MTLVPKKLNQAGDTIIEVMICLAIVSMVISGAYTSATRSLQVGQRAQERTEALKLAESQIERIKFLSANAASNIFLDPNDHFCIDDTYATSGDASKVNIADHTVYTPAMYGACLQSRYHLSVVYTGGTNNLFTVEAVWERLGALIGPDPADHFDRLKLFYRQPPNLSVALSPTPTIFATPSPTPPPGGGPGGSTCSPPYPSLTLRYNVSSPGGSSFDTGISLPPGDLTIFTYESQSPNDNGNPAEPEEQWHVSVGGVRSADTADVPDIDQPSGTRSISGGPLPVFNQPGGNIILEHRNVQANPSSTGENSVTPYQFCYILTGGPGGPPTPPPTPTPTPTPPPPGDCEFDVVRSKLGSLFPGASEPTPPTDAVGGTTALSSLWSSPNSTLYMSGIANTCTFPGNVISLSIYTDGAWDDTGQWADSVEVILRNKSTFATAPPVVCPDQTFYTTLKPAPLYGTSGAGWSNVCYVANYNGGSVTLTFSTVGLGSPEDFEFLVFADGLVVPPPNASGVPEIVRVEGPF